MPARENRGMISYMSTIERHVTRDLVSLPATASCREAARTMKERRIGAVGVIEGDEVVGLVAERDLALRVVGEGAGPEVPLGEIVRRDGPSVGPRASEKQCADLMRAHHVRHLLDRDGRGVAGVISMRDVIVMMMEEKELVIAQLEGYITGR
jgi:CBS domain-containing protein